MWRQDSTVILQPASRRRSGGPTLQIQGCRFPGRCRFRVPTWFGLNLTVVSLSFPISIIWNVDAHETFWTSLVPPVLQSEIISKIRDIVRFRCWILYSRPLPWWLSLFVIISFLFFSQFVVLFAHLLYFVFLLPILLLVCSLKNVSHLSSMLTLTSKEDVTNKEATNNNYTEMNLNYNNYSNNHNDIFWSYI